VTRIGSLGFAKSDLPWKNSHVVVLNLHDASAICFPEKPNFVHMIGMSVEKGRDVEEVRRGVQTWLGDRADVRTVETSKDMVSDVTAGLEIGFAIGGAGALVVGLFLVYKALSVSVAERRHDIGILRSVGATRGQIAGLFIGESLAMGLVGSALGLPIGWLMARVAIGPLSVTAGELIGPIDSAQVQLPAWLMVVAVLSGTLVAVLAALVPALVAAGEEPADAVRRVPRRQAVRVVAGLIAASVGLLLAGLAASHFRDQLPLRTGLFAGVVALFLGGLIATLLLASVVARFVQPLFRFLFGVEGRLAADNLVRSPGRTGLVIAALAATSALMVQTSGFLKSTRIGIYDWLEEKIDADLFVTSGSPVSSGAAALTMPEEFEKKLQKLDGVEAVLPVRLLQIDYDSQRTGQKHIVYLIALDTSAFEKGGADRPLARNLARFPRLREPGTVVVSENFASLYGVKVGDFIEIPAREETLKVEVVGLATDYTWNRGTILMHRPWFREKYLDYQVSVFDLFLKPGVDVARVHQEIMDRYGVEYNLFILSRPDVHADVHRTLTNIYSFVYAQQAIIGMVALLGVVSALFISVLQRRRELGLLRAVGATRGQILQSVLAEAVLMGLIGGVIGFGLGLVMEWYLLNVLVYGESGFLFPMHVPWLEAGVVCLASILFATLAGLWPAYHATTLGIPEAIAYE
jgi:putative ABC transport system permease protein